MAQQKFNVESGLAVGSIPLIEANGYANLGTVTSQYSNGNTVFGEVKINQDGTIYGNVIGNISGNIVVPGANTQIIFNNQGNAGASSGLTYDSVGQVLTVIGTANVEALNANGAVALGSLANVSITGGTSGQLIGSDGLGGLVWTSPAGIPTEIANGTSNVNIVALNGNVVTTAAGNQVLVVSSTGANVYGTANVSGAAEFGSSLTVAGAVNLSSSSNVDLGSVANLHIAGGTAGQVLSTDGAGNLTWSSDASYSNADVATYLASGTDTSNIITQANVTGGNLTTAGGVFADGVVAALGNITSAANITAQYIDANSDITAAGTVYGTTGVVSGGDITAAGNIGGAKLTSTGNLVVGGVSTLGPAGNVKITGGSNGYVLTTDGTGNLSWTTQTAAYGNADVAAYLASGNDSSDIITTANVTGGNVTTAGTVSGAVVTSSGAVSAGTTVTATGNVAGGNLTTGGQVVATGNISGGNLNTAGNVTATGNVTADNVNTLGQVQAIGNISGGNISTTGEASVGVLVVGTNANLGAVGNVVITGGSAGQLLSTDGFGGLSWSSPAGTPTEIANGTSSVNIPTADGNIVTTAGGNQVLTVTTTGANVTGYANISGEVFIGGDTTITGNLDVKGNVTYIESNVVLINDVAITLANNATTPAQANGGGFEINGANASFLYNAGSNTFVTSHTITGNITGEAGFVAAGNLTGSTLSANVTGSSLTSVGTLVSLDVTGAVTSGGNISAGNVNTSGQVVATGNVSGGNLTTAGAVVATGNVSGGNINTTGSVNATTGSVNAQQVVASTGVYVGTTGVLANTATVASPLAFALATLNVPAGRSVEFLTRGWDQGSNAVSVVTTMVVTDGNANVQYTNYGAVSVIATVGTVAAVYGATAGEVLLEITPANGNVTQWNTQYRLV